MTQTPPMKKIKYVFFGSSKLSLIVLEHLYNAGYIPSAIVTTPDKPKGRKLVLTPTETKVFGLSKNIEVFEFAKLDETAVQICKDKFNDTAIFIVASYGLIIPQSILDIPQSGVINIHPSLLPTYRGATPIQQAILDDRFDTGVSIMKMDAKMDHGPLLFQEKRKNMFDWPKKYTDLEHELAIQGADALIHILPAIADNQIIQVEQDHTKATFTKKITKADGCIDIENLEHSAGRQNFLKFCAYEVWPSTFFIVKKKDKEIRVKITAASWDNEQQKMIIEKVIPEGQKETTYTDFVSRVEQYY